MELFAETTLESALSALSLTRLVYRLRLWHMTLAWTQGGHRSSLQRSLARF